MFASLKNAGVKQLADVLVRALHGLVGLALTEVDFVEDLLSLAFTLRGDFFLEVILVALLESGEVDLKISTRFVDLYFLCWVLGLTDCLFFVPLAIVLTRAV